MKSRLKKYKSAKKKNRKPSANFTKILQSALINDNRLKTYIEIATGSDNSI